MITYVLDKIFGIHQAETDLGQKEHQIVFPVFRILVYPFQQYVPDEFFAFHIQLVVFDYPFKLVLSEFHQLIALFRNCRELFNDILIRSFSQLAKIIVSIIKLIYSNLDTSIHFIVCFHVMVLN